MTKMIKVGNYYTLNAVSSEKLLDQEVNEKLGTNKKLDMPHIFYYSLKYRLQLYRGTCAWFKESIHDYD